MNKQQEIHIVQFRETDSRGYMKHLVKSGSELNMMELLRWFIRRRVTDKSHLFISQKVIYLSRVDPQVSATAEYQRETAEVPLIETHVGCGGRVNSFWFKSVKIYAS